MSTMLFEDDPDARLFTCLLAVVARDRRRRAARGAVARASSRPQL
ncbi:MAG: hypothetical protein R3B36_32360 [Polyangiaceae bacterium]